jgi:hypothetical protein
MRDIERIDYICNEISKYWKKCPDIRFMQLINNFMAWLKSDGFYLEDDMFLKRFSEFMENFM